MIRNWIVKCRRQYAAALGLAAALAALSVVDVQADGSSAATEEFEVITAEVSVITVDSFTTISSLAGKETPGYAFRVQWEGKPQVDLNFAGRAKILHSPGTLALIPLDATARAFVFTVKEHSSVPVTLHATTIETIQVVGVARLSHLKSALMSPISSGPSEPSCSSGCGSGGPGATACSISGGNGCSVSCSDPYYACCNAQPAVTCTCCR